MNIEVNRLENLKRLIRGFPTQKAFAEYYGLSYSFINQLINGARPFKEKASRKIERAIGEKEGWMDHAHEQASDTASFGDQVTAEVYRNGKLISSDGMVAEDKKPKIPPNIQLAINVMLNPPKGSEELVKSLINSLTLIQNREEMRRITGNFPKNIETETKRQSISDK